MAEARARAFRLRREEVSLGHAEWLVVEIAAKVEREQVEERDRGSQR